MVSESLRTSDPCPVAFVMVEVVCVHHITNHAVLRLQASLQESAPLALNLSGIFRREIDSGNVETNQLDNPWCVTDSVGLRLNVDVAVV